MARWVESPVKDNVDIDGKRPSIEPVPSNIVLNVQVLMGNQSVMSSDQKYQIHELRNASKLCTYPELVLFWSIFPEPLIQTFWKGTPLGPSSRSYVWFSKCFLWTSVLRSAPYYGPHLTLFLSLDLMSYWLTFILLSHFSILVIFTKIHITSGWELLIYDQLVCNLWMI